MSPPGLTPSELLEQRPEDIRRSSTFRTSGIDDVAIERFLDTPEGTTYWMQLRSADPTVSASVIDERAFEQLRSGRDLPRMQVIDEPLVKIVPRGPVDNSLAYTPFFARQSAFEDAVSRGRNLSDYFALPIRSEAPVYDIYQIRPNGPTEVFVNTIAPSSELDGRITKPGGAEQYLVPNRRLYSEAVRVGSIGNDLALHQELVVERGLGGPIAVFNDAVPERIRAPRIGAGRALGIAGLALEVYDGAQTVREVGRLRGEGNATAAESELIHFGSRSVGGLGGAAIGAGAGGMFTSWTGPGVLIGGSVGGIAGVFGGEKFAEWTDNRRIYNQDDRAGNTWTFDPEHPGRGWERRASIDASLDGIDNARRGTLRAPPSLANELDYKATSTSVELILGGPPPQRKPFSLPANEHDAHSSRPSNWERDPDNGQWTRRVYGDFIERGMTPYHTETALSDRAEQLDRAAAKVVLENAHNSPASIAAVYEDAYIQKGWATHGPMPEAVRNARTDIDTLVASNERRYQRQADGRWTSDGMLIDRTASGTLRAELEATRAVLEAHLPPPREIPPPVPMTAEDRVRDTVAGAYANAGIDASPERIAATATAVQATWAARGLDPGTTALDIQPDAVGRRSLDSAIGHLRWDANAREYQLVAVTSVEEIRAAETVQQASPVVTRAPHDAMDDAIPTLATVSAVLPAGISRGDRLAATHGTPLADHPEHPDHDTFTRIHDWVRGTGQWDDAASRNVACALYREQACDASIRRVDLVAGGLGQNGEQNVFAFYAPYGDKGPFFHARVDGREAALEPAQSNLEQAELVRQQAAQQHRLDPQQRQGTQALHAPDLAM